MAKVKGCTPQGIRPAFPRRKLEEDKSSCVSCVALRSAALLCGQLQCSAVSCVFALRSVAMLCGQLRCSGVELVERHGQPVRNRISLLSKRCVASSLFI